ncbi:MAG TPA: hypothetical protein VLB80_04570 [Candidatus Babeliales bacterium]|nr:hypothetical protein [Candidatus Babeliales bacterium]
MNIFRTISRVLVVAVIVFAGNAVAGPEDSSYMKFGKGIRLSGLTFVGMAAASQLCEKDASLQRAGIETIGYLCNGLIIKKEKKEEVESASVFIEGMGHLAINYGIRKSSETLNKKGYNLDYVANICDKLPESVGYFINPAVRTVAEGVTQPEILTSAIMCVLIHCIIKPIVDFNPCGGGECD